MSTPPTKIGTTKRRNLRRAFEIYSQHFLLCKIAPVPDNTARIDVICREPLTYLQVADEPPTGIRVFSPCETTLHHLREMLSSVIQVDVAVDMTKVFSPESTLMGMYLPILQLVPLAGLLGDKVAVRNIRQSLDEAEEERFVHAIRATGIAAEELLVEIYETFLRDKAPEAPLGNLISELNGRLQEVVQGVKATNETSLRVARTVIGKAIEAEKQGTNSVCSRVLGEQIQKVVIPLLERLRQCIDDNPSLNSKAQKINLFPAHVQRCLSELVILRNRVSHRVERAVSVASVGYVDTAIALRDFIVVSKWWEAERRQINYKATRKAIIQETVKRSRSQEQEPENTD